MTEKLEKVHFDNFDIVIIYLQYWLVLLFIIIYHYIS